MKQYAWFIITVIFALMLCWRVNAFGQSPTTGSLAGSVYYTEARACGDAPAARVRMPIADAVVTVDGACSRVTTGPDGQFRINGLVEGSHTVTVSHRRFRDPFSTGVTVTPGQTTEVAAELGQGYYLAIGIGDYAEPDIEKLVGPAYDVRAVEKTLFASFQGTTTTLLNKQATKKHIQAAITQIAARMSPRDFFVLYFSGHGGSDQTANGKGWVNYLLPYDSCSDDYRHDISEKELAEYLQALPDPRRAILILDCCNAGVFFNCKQRHDCTLKFAEEQTFHLLDHTGMTVISAADFNESSVDCDDGSLFTNKLIEGLACKCKVIDTDQDHDITAKELFTYAAKATTAEAKSYHEKQHPQLQMGTNPVLLRY